MRVKIIDNVDLSHFEFDPELYDELVSLAQRGKLYGKVLNNKWSVEGHTRFYIELDNFEIECKMAVFWVYGYEFEELKEEIKQPYKEIIL